MLKIEEDKLHTIVQKRLAAKTHQECVNDLVQMVKSIYHKRVIKDLTKRYADSLKGNTKGFAVAMAYQHLAYDAVAHLKGLIKKIEDFEQKEIDSNLIKMEKTKNENKAN